MSGGFLPLAAMGFKAGGSLLQGIGAKNQANAAAAVDEENARLALLAGEQDVGTIMHRARAAEGAQIVAGAGSGGGLADGSAADLIRESEQNAQLDIAAVRTKAQREQANNLQAAADKRAAGKAALLQGVFGAVGSVLEGASAMRDRRLLLAQRMKEQAAVLGGSAGTVGGGSGLVAPQYGYDPVTGKILRPRYAGPANY